MGIGTTLIQGFRGCFGLGRRDPGSPTPQASNLAARSSPMPPPEAPRAPPTRTGFFAKLRFWQTAAVSEPPRTTPDPRVPLSAILRGAPFREVPAQYANKAIAGRLNLDEIDASTLPSAKDSLRVNGEGPATLLAFQVIRNTLLNLRSAGARLSDVVLTGKIRVPSDQRGWAAIELVNALISAGNETDPLPVTERVNASGVIVETHSGGVDITQKDQLDQIENAISLATFHNMKVGPINLKGEIRDIGTLERVYAVVGRANARGGKIDLRGLKLELPIDLDTSSVRHQEIPSVPSPVSILHSKLSLLKAFGANTAGIDFHGALELNQASEKDLRSLLAIVDQGVQLCSTTPRNFDNLTISASVPGYLINQASADKPYDVSARAKLLERARRRGAQIKLSGTVTYGTGRTQIFGALHALARLKGTDVSNVNVSLPDPEATFTLQPGDLRKMEYLHQRGATVDQQIKKLARAAFKSKVFVEG